MALADEVAPGPQEHSIDLTGLPPAPGRPPDLEAKRRRAWSRLAGDQRRWAVLAYDRPIAHWEMPCGDAGGAYERVLYALVVLDTPLSPEEVSYLLIARWYRNSDVATIRARLARMVQAGEAKWAGRGRYVATSRGVDRLRERERQWLERGRGSREVGRRASQQQEQQAAEYRPPRGPGRSGR